METPTQPEYLHLKPDPGPNDPVIGRSGTPYKWHLDLSVPRYKQLDLLGLEFLYNATFDEITQSDNRMWQFMKNKPDFTEAVLELHKRREHMVNLTTGRNAGVEVSALFLIAPGEDPAVFDLTEQQRKVADLEAAGYRSDFFFSIALDAVPGSRKHLQTLVGLLSSLSPTPSGDTLPPASDSTSAPGVS